MRPEMPALSRTSRTQEICHANRGSAGTTAGTSDGLHVAVTTAIVGSGVAEAEGLGLVGELGLLLSSPQPARVTTSDKAITARRMATSFRRKLERELTRS